MTYQILCEVMGGITGYRCAYFKANGDPVVFLTKDKAEIEANRLTAEMNHPNTRATYRYTAEVMS